MAKSNLALDISLLKNYVSETDIRDLQPLIDKVRSSLYEKTCAGSDFLGWIDLPYTIQKEMPRIKQVAQEIHDNSDHLISIGIGGSYLGARAAIDFLADPFIGNKRVLFFGHHISSDYTASLLDYVLDKSVYANVISKSGTTTEPAVAFRLLRDALSKKYSQDELQKRIITTTDKSKGVLRGITDSEGYRSFIIEDDIGGRFSVLGPVGLLPIAAAGYDIDALVHGAQDMADYFKSTTDVLENDILTYAAARFLLYQQNKTVEILSAFEPNLQYIGEWWKQLFGESEGKENKSIYPTSANLTTDLHSLGQYMQEGSRFLFETFLTLQNVKNTVTIPNVSDDTDKLNFLSGKSVEFVNRQAHRGTQYAHSDGDLPNMTLTIPERSEYALGQLFCFFEFAVAISGLLLEVNPFNQPGVEAYKQNMFALLGKPGYEQRKTELEKEIQGE